MRIKSIEKENARIKRREWRRRKMDEGEGRNKEKEDERRQKSK